METHEETHILNHLQKLVELTTINTTLITRLQQCKLLGIADLSELEAENNKLKKSHKFYMILLKKKNSYKHLLVALDESNQTGASEILRGNGVGDFDIDSIGKFNGTRSRMLWLGLLAVLTAIVGYTLIDSENQYFSFVFNLTYPQKDTLFRHNKDSFRFNVQKPVVNFTGRDQEVSELHEKLQISRGENAIVSIVGLGGIGKTELVRKYIQEYGQYYDGNVWINAETNNSLQESFRQLATDHLKISSFNIDGNEKYIATVVLEVYKYFEQSASLFVFDNAEYEADIRLYLPIDVPNPPFVLITSRNTQWAFETLVIKLGELAGNDSLNFVRKCLGIMDTDQESEILTLVTLLRNFPLALSQAVSYIEQRRVVSQFRIYDYILLFQKDAVNLLNTSSSSVLHNTYKETTYSTWRITMERISRSEKYGMLAKNLLDIISYFAPQGIPIYMFASAEPGHEHDHEFAINLLVKYSMVNINPTIGSISVHRLVQQVTRDTLMRNNQTVTILEQVVNIIRPKTLTIDSRFPLQALVAFTYCLEHNSFFKNLKEISLLIFETLESNFMYNDALFFVKWALSDLEKAMPMNDINIIKLLHKSVRLDYHSKNKDLFAFLAVSYAPCLKSCNNTQWIYAMLDLMAGPPYTVLPTFTTQLNRSCLNHKCDEVLVRYCMGIAAEIPESKSICLTAEDVAMFQNELPPLDDISHVKFLLYQARCLNSKITNETVYIDGLHSREELQKLVLANGISSRDRNSIANCQVLKGSPHRKKLEVLTDKLYDKYEQLKDHISTEIDWGKLFFDLATFLTTICQYDRVSVILSGIHDTILSPRNDFQILKLQTLYLIANMKLLEGNWENAYKIHGAVVTDYTEILGSQHLETVLMTMRIADNLFALGHFDTALRGYRLVLEKFPDRVPKPLYKINETVIYDRLDELLVAASVSIEAYQLDNEESLEVRYYDVPDDVGFDYITFWSSWEQITDNQNRFKL